MVNIFILYHIVKLLHYMWYLPKAFGSFWLKKKEGQSPQKTPPKKRSIWRPYEPHRRKWFGQWHEFRVHIPKGCLHPKPLFGIFRDHGIWVLSSDIEVFYTWNFPKPPKKKQHLLEMVQFTLETNGFLSAPILKHAQNVMFTEQLCFLLLQNSQGMKCGFQISVFFPYSM